MTLFNVDEAATRIREEADQDANIIVGTATICCSPPDHFVGPADQ